MVALRRMPLFAAAAAALLAGMAAGEGRLGWPGPSIDLMAVHGPLMVSGFFGTVIGLERAVALDRPVAFAAPALSAVGALALLAGFPGVGALAMVLGSLGFVAMAAEVLRRQHETFTLILALGALCWLVGNLIWLSGRPPPEAVPAWAGFLVLTIAGERLELSRFLPPWRWRTPTLIPILALLLAGIGLSVAGHPLTWPVFGGGLMALTVWSLGNDVIRRTIRQPGLTRYVAIALASGYVWAAVAGLLMTGLGFCEGGERADAALHALFIGFVFAMVFGHAPVIAPAVLKVQLPFKPYFYGPLALLHAALLLRLAGDLAEIHALRQWGGLANGAAILVFLVTMAATAILARRR